MNFSHFWTFQNKNLEIWIINHLKLPRGANTFIWDCYMFLHCVCTVLLTNYLNPSSYNCQIVLNLVVPNLSHHHLIVCIFSTFQTSPFYSPQSLGWRGIQLHRPVVILMAFVSWHTPYTCCRCDPLHEGQGDQAHCHGPGSSGSHDRVAELGETLCRAAWKRGTQQPAEGEGEEIGERLLQRPQRWRKRGSLCCRWGTKIFCDISVPLLCVVGDTGLMVFYNEDRSFT